MSSDLHVQQLQLPDIAGGRANIDGGICDRFGRQFQNVIDVSLVAGTEIKLTAKRGEIARGDLRA
ncbi:hypothetical protein D3C78_1789960 [compost metagenome]